MVQYSDSIKAIVGGFLLKSGIWAKNIIDK